MEAIQTRLPSPTRDRQATRRRTSVNQSNLSPDDGYDYSESGPSPEGSATQEQDNVNLSKMYLQASASSNAPGHYEDHQGESNPDYRRFAQEWRAKVPDEEDIASGVSAPSTGRIQSSTAVNQDGRSGGGNRQIERTLTIGRVYLRYVLLQWEKEKLDGKLIIDALSPGFNAKVESPNHVVWQ